MSENRKKLYAPLFAHDLVGLKALLLILAAGFVGELVVEFIAWVIAPPLLGRPIEPAILVQNLAKMQLGLEISKSLGFIVHVLAGMYFFVIGYVFFADATKLKPAWLVGGLWGLVVWVCAQGFFAPLAGRPFFLGFIPYTWWSSIMHTMYGVAIGVSLEYFAGKFGYVGKDSRTPSRWIVGATTVFVLAVMVNNYTFAPPVGFVNVEGYWSAAGDGPHTGCLWLKQDGAGVTLTGYLSREAIDTGSTDLNGRVDGQQLTLESTSANPAQSVVLRKTGNGAFIGRWIGREADWTLTRTNTECM